MSARPPAEATLRPHPVVATLSMIRFAHTVFAMPFALLAAVLAARGVPPLATLFWILVAMVGARSAAMSFNRIADREVDARNPRTAARELPSGVLSLRFAVLFCAASAGLFVFAAAQLNRLCLLLSPVALAVVLGYSLTKRFTALSHLVLGLSLAIAPVGAWIAVTGSFALLPVVLALAVVFWVAGFDVIYSLQDEAFDREQGLQSLPARLGNRRALLVSALFHAAALALLYAAFALADGGLLFGLGVVLAGAFLVRQHAIVKPGDLSRVDAAFFTANGWLSIVLFACGAADVLSRAAFPR
ncbi:MAG TPA: UbiA-like polyprenyltransferase [Thermoanaerobaculia bacterium]|nr:UbiA-like polyprenyltransferase [Thermoanaerobaculia bacterium]HQR66019.1 UbiA-like polyprenyltransferase [Thermoanaerobaculia bacterium]